MRKVRMKHGQMPGDYNKTVKIRMRERRQGFDYLGLYVIGPNAIRSFRHSLKMRERAVANRQALSVIEEQLQGDLR